MSCIDNICTKIYQNLKEKLAKFAAFNNKNELSQKKQEEQNKILYGSLMNMNRIENNRIDIM